MDKDFLEMATMTEIMDKTVKFNNAVELAEAFTREIARKPKFADYMVTMKAGQTWIRIFAEIDTPRFKNRHVLAFMDMDGNLWKAASLNAPQKNGLRYKAEDVMTVAVENADPYGAFLYAR